MKAMPLRNITSSVLLPPAACDDILYYPEKGQQGYEDLIKTRLLPTSTISIWDTLPQLKLTRFMTWIKKKTIKVGDKVIKLREDRQLYSQIINIAQKRPEIITGMQHLVSEYEMSIVPRANFNPDGSMLLCLDKASLMKSIQAQPPTIEDISSPEDRTQVMIVDGMVDVNCLKKKNDTKKMLQIKQQFINRIQEKERQGNYSEIRVLFDEYCKEDSLKDQMREKRAGNDSRNGEGYEFHDEMCVKQTPLTELTKADKSKKQLTQYLATGLLEAYNEKTVKVIVTYHGKICINNPHSLSTNFTTHGHEEADTQIPLHVIHSLRDSTHKHFDIYSIDTDVLVLLMDLVSRDNLGPSTNVILHAGKSKTPKPIDVVKRVDSIGKQKSQGLIGMHNYTGNDFGHKSVGISKERWCNKYFSLPPNDPIVKAFGSFGTLSTEQCSLVNGELHKDIRALEEFTCMPYSKDGPLQIPALRWKLFNTENKEAENLPPCRATLVPHIQRCNYLSLLHKSYHQAHPQLPPLIDNGWTKDKDSDVIRPKHCLIPPASKSILELVKCGCKTGDCSTNRCSCYKIKLPCTSLCSCSDICSNT